MSSDLTSTPASPRTASLGASLLSHAARDVTALRCAIVQWRRDGLRVALTPTMGALHEGHLGLIRTARAWGADRVVASIFVNPTQFGPTEDFDAYPRDTPRDADLLAGAGCDLLYLPQASAMYPPGFATEVRVTGLTDRLCGAARPGHFDGVALVVSKLLLQAGADMAVFGEKDWQQLAVIRRLTSDLDIPTQIVGAPTERDADGLALSSRNAYLTAAERAVAPRLHGALQDAAAAIREGRRPEDACAEARSALLEVGFSKVDYFSALDGETLDPLAVGSATTASERDATLSQARLFAAAHLGRARLIDNIAIPLA
ncbi:MAG: pantoate--beta-alanine ligase [Pseudomonadota bacterium]